MTEAHHEIVLTPPARGAFAEELPEAVAAAVIDFVTTALLERPTGWASPSVMTRTGSGPLAE